MSVLGEVTSSIPGLSPFSPGGPEEEAKVERVVFEVNLTILSFLHIRSWARNSEDFLAPLDLAAKQELRL